MHNKKEELEYKLETREKKDRKEEITICTSAAKEMDTSTAPQQNVVTTDQQIPVEETYHNNNNNNNNKEKDEMMYKEDEDTSPDTRPPLKYAYRRRELSERKRKAQTSILFLQQTFRHQNKKEELYKLETREKKHGKEEITICTSAAKETGTSAAPQQNVVTTDQRIPVEETYHNNNNKEKDELMYKEDEDTSPRLKHAYRRRELSERKRKAQTSILFLQQTFRYEVQLKRQQRNIQNSLPTIARVETVSSKSSSRLKQKKKGHGRKLQALKGSSPRSVPRKRNRTSNTLVRQDIEEMEEEELNSRRQTYLPYKNEKSPSIFNHAPKEFYLVDTHRGYKESLLNFAKNLGPTTQSTASKKLKLLTLAQARAHAFLDPIPHPSSSWKLCNDPKGKSVVMDKGSGRNSVSARDERPMGSFGRVDTLIAGSACISSFTGASGIQKSADVVHGIIRENVHCPTHSHNKLVLQQQHRPPGDAAVTNAYTVRPGYQVPIAYEAQRGTRGVVSRSQNLPPWQIAYPLTTVSPSTLNAVCTASGADYGIWGGHQSTPLNELQIHANPAALGQGFQQTLHRSHMMLQNQLGSEAHQQQQMALEQQPLPLLRNMFDAGTSHTGTSTSGKYHQTTSNAARNGQQLPLAGTTCPNLELQLRTYPLSPDEAS